MLVQVGHKLVLDQLLEYIYNGFLVPVMGAALLEVCIFVDSHFLTENWENNSFPFVF